MDSQSEVDLTIIIAAAVEFAEFHQSLLVAEAVARYAETIGFESPAVFRAIELKDRLRNRENAV